MKFKTHPHIHKHTVTAEATLAVKPNPRRLGLLIYNNGASIIEVVETEKDTYGEGIPIPPQKNYENLYFCQGAYYLICASGTVDSRIEEDIED